MHVLRVAGILLRYVIVTLGSVTYYLDAAKLLLYTETTKTFNRIWQPQLLLVTTQSYGKLTCFHRKLSTSNWMVNFCVGANVCLG